MRSICGRAALRLEREFARRTRCRSEDANLDIIPRALSFNVEADLPQAVLADRFASHFRFWHSEKRKQTAAGLSSGQDWIALSPAPTTARVVYPKRTALSILLDFICERLSQRGLQNCTLPKGKAPVLNIVDASSTWEGTE